MRPNPLILLIAIALLAPAAHAAPDYLRDVKPLLAVRCYACHGGLKQKEGLRVDTIGLMKKGGNAGPAILPGNAEKSLIIDHVLARGDAPRMPPESEGEQLKPAEVALLKAWIDAGAQGPADERPESDPRDHWAFKPPTRAALPPIGNPQSAIGNPIDALLTIERTKHNLTPQPPAPRGLLLRRVTLDLTGLPPTPAEYADFLADPSPDAYEKVVDRLLASTHYGERWGRHWMDVWRYSDWWGLGADVRNSTKHIWHWREWVVQSLNANKPYDQMVREMLAADELYPTDADKLRATGYLARQYFKFNRNTWLEETVEHTSKAFLGLTVNCAKCHDHKFDPVSQHDFYAMRAFFEPYQVRNDVLGGQTDFEKDGLPRAFDCNLDTPTYLFARGDERNPRKDKPIAPAVPAILAFDKLTIAPVKLPPDAYQTALRPDLIDAQLKAAADREAAAQKAFDQAKATAAEAAVHDAELEGPKAAPPPHAELTLALTEKSLATATLNTASLKARIAADRAAAAQQPAAPDAKALAQAASTAERNLAVATADEAVAKAALEAAQAAAAKAPVAATVAAAKKKLAAARDALAKAKKDAEKPGETYAPLRGAQKIPESNVETEASRNRPFPATSTGRRTALANWITDPRNPLAARVAVNHIWARHFGRPLVATVFDFGRKGALPTNQALLDHLAVDFRESGWDMKRLHRLMVTSDAYRMTSSAAGASAATLAADPDNRHLWRMNPIRMESEVVRDSLLHLAGDLDLTPGGPSIPITQPSKRRSLYFVHSNTEHQQFLASFDDANVLECYRRAESIVPQQSLALENSKLVLESAAKIAGRIEAKEDAAFVTAAFTMILGSEPTPEEQGACEAALAQLKTIATTDKKPDPAKRARINLVHALLNHNDFLTIR